jgi:hypothetical protein
MASTRCSAMSAATRLMSAVADHERRAWRHCPVEAGSDHHHPLAGIDQGINHMATDIACAAGDQKPSCPACAQVDAVAGSEPVTWLRNRRAGGCACSPPPCPHSATQISY